MRSYRHGGIESTELTPAREQRLRVLILCGKYFLSVNAKQLERPVFQAGPNRCESDHGCQSWLNAICSQGVISSARRFAKPEARGANPRESTIPNAERGVRSAERAMRSHGI